MHVLTFCLRLLTLCKLFGQRLEGNTHALVLECPVSPLVINSYMFYIFVYWRHNTVSMNLLILYYMAKNRSDYSTSK